MTKKKKILCISVMEHWGGGEEFLVNLANNVKDYEFIIVSSTGEPLRVFEQNNIKTVEVKSLKKYYQQGGSWTLYTKLKIVFNIIITTFKMIGVILNYRIDMVLANGNFAGIYGFLAAAITKRKFIAVQHLIYKSDSTEAKILKLLDRYSAKLVCISNSVYENVKSILGDNSENVLVIPHGIELPEIKIIENKRETINIGIVGSIIRLKAIDIIINSAMELIFQNRNIHLHIFGSVRKDEADSIEYEKELIKLIVDNNLSDNIHFRGFEKSKYKIYNDLDIVINYSSMPESFSFTVLEAMSFGKIVIASDVGGPKELISNNENGFLIPPTNEIALKKMLEFCIPHLYSSEFSEIRKRARKTAEEKYSLKRFSSDYTIFFDSILSS